MTGQRMTQKEYRKYLLDKGIKVSTASALSQGGEQIASGPAPRKNKYNAKPVHDADGKFQYASRREARRGAELDLLSDRGIIIGLRKQPRYPFKANPKRGMTYPLVYDSGRIVTYVPDFEYYDLEGELIIEDVKGVRTAIYKMKKAALLAYYGFEVVEI